MKKTRYISQIDIGQHCDAWVQDTCGCVWYDTMFTNEYDVGDKLPNGLELCNDKV